LSESWRGVLTAVKVWSAVTDIFAVKFAERVDAKFEMEIELSARDEKLTGVKLLVSNDDTGVLLFYSGIGLLLSTA
jgi:hypothetical protein